MTHRGSGTPPSASGREEGIVLTGLIALFVITAAWWALALWPIDNGPAWLERTRYVCFGVAESGLPDAGGWIGLVFGPLGMLSILLIAWWRGAIQLVERARSSRMVMITLATLALGGTVLVIGAAARVQQAKSVAFVPEIGDELPPPGYPRLDRASPPLALVGQDGATHRLEDLRGRPVLVTFAFAHCETICPVVVSHVLAAQRELRSAGTPTAVLVVTLDPWRDTPSRLPSMAEAWRLPDRDAWVLSGEVAAVESALDAWEVPRTRDLTTGDVTHPSLVYIVDRVGRIAYATTGGAASIAALVERLQG